MKPFFDGLNHSNGRLNCSNSRMNDSTECCNDSNARCNDSTERCNDSNARLNHLFERLNLSFERLNLSNARWSSSNGCKNDSSDGWNVCNRRLKWFFWWFQLFSYKGKPTRRIKSWNRGSEFSISHSIRRWWLSNPLCVFEKPFPKGRMSVLCRLTADNNRRIYFAKANPRELNNNL